MTCLHQPVGWQRRGYRCVGGRRFDILQSGLGLATEQMQFDQLKRRDFITLLGGAAAAWPLASRERQGGWGSTIGFLASQPRLPIQRFARELTTYGYIQGQ